MKNRRDLFLPSFSTLILFGLIWFISCSHQMKMRKVAETDHLAEEGDSQEFLSAVENELKEKEDWDKSTEHQVVQQEKVQAAEEPVKAEPVLTEKAAVATAPIPSEGASLNRFYFLRKGDTPKKVSEMIYGNSRFAKNILSWNTVKWLPGEVIYYQSPKNKKDSKLGSFYQEKKLSPSEYRVAKGDSLSLIAKRFLGHYRSWKEIATVNGLKEVNQIPVGVRLALYAEVPQGENEVVAAVQAPIPVEKSVPEPSVKTPKVQEPPRVQSPAPVQPVPQVQAPAPVRSPQPAQPQNQNQNQNKRVTSSTPASKVSDNDSLKTKVFKFFADVVLNVSEWIEEVGAEASKKFKK